ncbi:Tad domain-containing protein, partial [Vibrio caribbeanicus]|uniref:Tad domain-containing protein n=1 Tax=Vibrio caribbeanicus TaxID=701175 RepID=UPI0030D7131A
MHFNQSILKQHGSVTISYLVMLIPIVIAAASTIVIGYQVQLSNRAMQAADAASFACEFKGEYDQDLIQGYLDYYRPKIDKVKGQIGTNSGCNVSLGYSLSTIFTSLTLSDASSVVSSTANEKSYVTEYVTSEPLELIMVLDISTSMHGDIDDLKAILKRGLVSLQDQQNNAPSKSHIKVSIVPFASGVSVNNAPWLNDKRTLCVDGTTESGGKDSWAHTVANLDTTHDQIPVKTAIPNEYLYDCSATSVTLPLTADLDQVTNAIDLLEVDEETASYQGLIWGLRQLTPNWQKAWEVGPNRNFD